MSATRMHIRARSSADATRCVRYLRLPTPRRSRVPTALCVCRAWDRHCLLLLVLLSPGHGRSRRLGLAWPIEIALPSNSIILNKHAPSNVSQTCHSHLANLAVKRTCYEHSLGDSLSPSFLEFSNFYDLLTKLSLEIEGNRLRKCRERFSIGNITLFRLSILCGWK